MNESTLVSIFISTLLGVLLGVIIMGAALSSARSFDNSKLIEAGVAHYDTKTGDLKLKKCDE